MPNFNGLWTSRQQMQARGGNTWPAVPGAPTSPVATAGNASASVAFTAPAYTGYPANAITGYRVTSSPGGFTGTGLTSPVTVTGLTNGTAYTFTVAAQNVNGYGPESVASSSVTPAPPNYIEEVFSTYLYTGTGTTQTITNNINLSGLGGLLWVKSRSGAYNNLLLDTARGDFALLSNLTTAQSAFDWTANSNGFSSVTDSVAINGSGATYASWTFREQTKFFDVVTYTGNGAGNQDVAHNLGSQPGCIIVKKTSSTGNWIVYHQSISGGENIRLNTTGTAAAFGSPDPLNINGPALFSVGAGPTADDNLNTSGATYVAYLFAHNAGGFGLTGNDNVISCGTYNGNSTTNSINLGYEPQWLLIKRTTVAASDWVLLDNMRGLTVATSDAALCPNNANAEGATVSVSGAIRPTATGFDLLNSNSALNVTGSSYIYIAIRRGPMKVPTLGTSVFQPVIYSGNGSNDRNINTTITPDLIIDMRRDNIMPKYVLDRMRANGRMYSNLTNAESTNTAQFPANTFNVNQTGITVSADEVNTSGRTYVLETFRRAPGFFDVVCYTGTGSATTQAHNLAAIPELMIIKKRNSSTNGGWLVGFYVSASTGIDGVGLNDTAALNTRAWSSGNFNSAPTSSVFGIGSFGVINASADTYVAYLFATLAGVSKVGSYTGTGATQTIACGFAAGARFVLIKRTDTTGDWYVWDSVRGMVVGTDPSLLLNTTAAEVNANSVYTITTGFQIVSTAAGINASGGTYIFLAIA
jgi:hypothetical protein